MHESPYRSPWALPMDVRPGMPKYMVIHEEPVEGRMARQTVGTYNFLWRAWLAMIWTRLWRVSPLGGVVLMQRKTPVPQCRVCGAREEPCDAGLHS